MKYKRYPLKSMFTFPKPKDISWNKWIRWHLWEIIEYQFFYPLIFHDKRAGRWTAIQLAKLYCYVGAFLLQ